MCLKPGCIWAKDSLLSTSSLHDKLSTAVLLTSRPFRQPLRAPACSVQSTLLQATGFPA